MFINAGNDLIQIKHGKHCHKIYIKYEPQIYEENFSNCSSKHLHKAYKRNWQGMSIKILLLRESKANTCSPLKDTWLADLKYLTKFGQFIEPYEKETEQLKYTSKI